MKEKNLYYGVFYPLLSYGFVLWGHSAKALFRRIFILQERAVVYTAGFKELESCRHNFRNLRILTVY
jgi:hypothetical protein